MKRLKITCIALLSMVCSISCHQKTVTDFGAAEHRVSVKPAGDTLSLSKDFPESELVTLTGCSVAKVREAIQIPSGFVLSGKFYTISESGKTESEVALFDREGAFVSHIARKGRSGEEVIDLQSIKYNPYSGTVDVLADYGRRIVCYDTQSWKVKSEEQLSDTDIKVAVDFIPVNATQYLFSICAIRT